MATKKLDMLKEAWLKGISADLVTAHGPNGDALPGLRWRLQTRRPGTGKVETTDWVFAPLPEVEQMIRYLQGKIALSRTDRTNATKQ